MAQDGIVMSLETSDRGFGLTKEVAEKDGEHVQLDLEIASTYDEEAVVTVEETVPPGTDHSQIGFLPNHEPEEWDLSDDGTLLLTARLVPEGTRQIIYGLREIEPAEADPLGNEPRVVDVGGPAATAVPDPEPAAPAGVDDGGAAEAAGAETDGGAGAEVSAAAAALEGSLDDEQAAELADALEPHLDVRPDGDPVTETKLSQLQEDVADVRAYLPAFEQFLGETGRAEDIIDELETVKDSLQELEGFDDRLADLEDGPEDLEETIGDVEESLASIEETVEAVDDRVAGVEERVESMDERLASLEGWRESIAAASQPADEQPGGGAQDGEADADAGDSDTDDADAGDSDAGDVDAGDADADDVAEEDAE